MKINADKVKHFIACLAISAVAAIIQSVAGANYLQSFVAGVIAGGAIGIGKEYGDQCSSIGHWDWSDILADLLGAIVGAASGSLMSL